MRDLVALIGETGHSRFPVTRGDLDETIGIVHLSRSSRCPPQRDRTRLDTLAQPVPVVPSTLDGDSLMAQIHASGLQTALVADEYGGIAGMVTVEDLIEEIVGDIRDEHDESTPTSSSSATAGGFLGPAAHRRGGRRHRFPGARGRLRDHRRSGHARPRHIPAAGESVELDRLRPDAPLDGQPAGAPPWWRWTAAASTCWIWSGWLTTRTARGHR